jgi:hypothetical protein
VVPTVAIPVESGTLRAVLDQVFARHPKVRSYVLDDQERLRKHVVIFVDGARVEAGDNLKRILSHESEVFVLQALSGG